MAGYSESVLKAVITERETGRFGEMVHFVASTGSTNDIAKQMAEGGVPEGLLVIADEQTAGRGRLGRSWIAEAGSSLLMSVLFRPDLPPAHIYRLVMACGLAAAEACETEAGVKVAVKWPNDLQIGGKKLAGILPESALVGDLFSWVIVGMGINVNQRFTESDPLAEIATSLYEASGNTVDRAVLLGNILEGLQRWHQRLGDEALVKAWRDRCVTLGKAVEIQAGERMISGMAEEIDATGALWLRDKSGARQCISAGEVQS